MWQVANKVQLGHWGGFTKIRIRSSRDCIYGIQFSYANKDNRQYNSPQYGSFTGGFSDVTLNIPHGQNFVNVKGTYDRYKGSTVITSLSFRVGGTTYGPYGLSRGTAFSLPLGRGKFTGFYGVYGDCLDSFGVTISPNN
ncbi:agglutinin [Artemisia annua]|uniref:Agglutinin n=1 Tax=Artemisia annua TaxID=35608 RepID=A0A2U1NBV6_ARTAN|nr:agglutinin [Artemisia annua]